ncbi:B12-binding domain-containing radical SAM protein [Streptomyces sp. FH025]|uniref:B12-binding domain-containing radical SAM protein n=1 Tax=Streptomyces sp. FH025 TaxID=2815937 RepID=UPI001A9E54B0|nr:radical SAM protein [Streptomyces sp. FH025]MBO1413659.1 radical SAM protein [Streptomyces sp. FH025]
MRALLMCGLGPSYVNLNYLRGSLFDASGTPRDERTRAMLERGGCADLDFTDFTYTVGGERRTLCRPRTTTVPHLTTFALEAILQEADQDYARVDLAGVWSGQAVLPPGDFDVVLLSTTYMWSKAIFAKVIDWIAERLPSVPVVCGGQYTNLKFLQVMAEFPGVTAVVRGDGEQALPAVLKAVGAGRSLEAVPGAVWRDGERVRVNPLEYLDFDAQPSPRLKGRFPIVPYESMRGCPFDCKFCSFPAASPKWRYKSAEKIRDDWMRYAVENGAQMISAMDSTFTVPPTRLRRLLEILPEAGVRWEGFSRANTVDSPALVDALLEAHCYKLHIGFEAMSDEVLKLMSKRVSAKQNRRAFHALRDSELGYVVFFMIGYPGETPELFGETRDFLVQEYAGHFMLNFFSISDETMPLWQDRERLRIEVEDPDDTHTWWSHIGMNSDDARELQLTALDDIRERNDDAVLLLWQHQFDHWLMPERSRRDNLRVEKCMERLALAPRVHTDTDTGARQIHQQLRILRELGVEPTGARALAGAGA